MLFRIRHLIMSGSGKGLLGVWLYRRGDNWAIKEGSPIHKSSDVRCIQNWCSVGRFFSLFFFFFNFFLIVLFRFLRTYSRYLSFDGLF